MNQVLNDTNEKKAANAFTKQAVVFDDLYSTGKVMLYKRDRVRAHVRQYLPPKSLILELNCGTGEDAIWFARQGHEVHATDISGGMLQVLNRKIKAEALEEKISTALCSFSELENLENKGPYDLIFSNFAGLNCSGDLGNVLRSFSLLLKDKGRVTLVILPEFCLWETLMLFRGKFRTAFRRFFNRRGAEANVEGERFRCWYYNPSYIMKQLAGEFDLLAVEGLCTLVPPSYIADFGEKYPRVFNWLRKKEDRYKTSWPWRNIGDYYMISLQKKEPVS